MDDETGTDGPPDPGPAGALRRGGSGAVRVVAAPGTTNVMTLSSIVACTTCRPQPTASANRPYFTAPVSSAMAFGTAASTRIKTVASPDVASD